MAKIEIFKNNQITVFYHQEEKIVHHECHKPFSGQPFRDAILKATEVLQKNNASKWLSDDRLNPLLTPDDQKWATEIWQPKIIKAGWKYWGIVLPQQALGQMRMSMMGKEYAKLGVTVNCFDNPDKALSWLKSV